MVVFLAKTKHILIYANGLVKCVSDKVIILRRKLHLDLPFFMNMNTKYTQSCLVFAEIVTAYIYLLDKASIELDLKS